MKFYEINFSMNEETISKMGRGEDVNEGHIRSWRQTAAAEHSKKRGKVSPLSHCFF